MEKKALTLQLELSDLCPLNCIMCRRRWHEKRACFGNMKLETIRAILGDIKRVDAQFNIMLQWGGEPLLNENAPFAISAFKELGARVDLYTSAFCVNQDIISALCKLALGNCMVIISLDGDSGKKYSQIKGLEDESAFERVLDGIYELLRERKKSWLLRDWGAGGAKLVSNGIDPGGVKLMPDENGRGGAKIAPDGIGRGGAKIAPIGQMADKLAIGIKLIAMEENLEEIKGFVERWSKALYKPILYDCPSKMTLGQDGIIIAPLNRRVDSTTQKPWDTHQKALEIARSTLEKEGRKTFFISAEDGKNHSLDEKGSTLEKEGGKNPLPTEKASAQQLKKSFYPCRHLYDNLTIAADGTITTCCADDDLNRCLGDGNKGFIHALSHPLRKSLKNQHLAGKPRGLCENCAAYSPLEPNIASAWGDMNLSELIDFFGKERVFQDIFRVLLTGKELKIRETLEILMENQDKEGLILAASAGFILGKIRQEGQISQEFFAWPQALEGAKRVAFSNGQMDIVKMIEESSEGLGDFCSF